jgi:hypothetical protein
LTASVEAFFAEVTLPFIEERLKEVRALMGEDFWLYGVESNRKVSTISSTPPLGR